MLTIFFQNYSEKIQNYSDVFTLLAFNFGKYLDLKIRFLYI